MFFDRILVFILVVYNENEKFEIACLISFTEKKMAKFEVRDQNK
jgi:hypothetical protein